MYSFGRSLNGQSDLKIRFQTHLEFLTVLQYTFEKRMFILITKIGSHFPIFIHLGDCLDIPKLPFGESDLNILNIFKMCTFRLDRFCYKLQFFPYVPCKLKSKSPTFIVFEV